MVRDNVAHGLGDSGQSNCKT